MCHHQASIGDKSVCCCLIPWQGGGMDHMSSLYYIIELQSWLSFIHVDCLISDTTSHCSTTTHGGGLASTLLIISVHSETTPIQADGAYICSWDVLWKSFVWLRNISPEFFCFVHVCSCKFQASFKVSLLKHKLPWSHPLSPCWWKNFLQYGQRHWVLAHSRHFFPCAKRKLPAAVNHDHQWEVNRPCLF